MKTLHFNAIIFAYDDHDIISAITKPSAWPSLKFYSSKLLAWLHDIVDCKAQFHSYQNIIGAKLIARSVIKEDLFNHIFLLVFLHGLTTFLFRLSFDWYGSLINSCNFYLSMKYLLFKKWEKKHLTKIVMNKNVTH